MKLNYVQCKSSNVLFRATFTMIWNSTYRNNENKELSWLPDHLFMLLRSSRWDEENFTYRLSSEGGLEGFSRSQIWFVLESTVDIVILICIQVMSLFNSWMAEADRCRLFPVFRGLYSSSRFTKFTLSDGIIVITSTEFLSDTVDTVDRIIILTSKTSSFENRKFGLTGYNHHDLILGDLCHDVR